MLTFNGLSNSFKIAIKSLLTGIVNKIRLSTLLILGL